MADSVWREGKSRSRMADRIWRRQTGSPCSCYKPSVIGYQLFLHAISYKFLALNSRNSSARVGCFHFRIDDSRKSW